MTDNDILTRYFNVLSMSFCTLARLRFARWWIHRRLRFYLLFGFSFPKQVRALETKLQRVVNELSGGEVSR